MPVAIPALSRFTRAFPLNIPAHRAKIADGLNSIRDRSMPHPESLRYFSPLKELAFVFHSMAGGGLGEGSTLLPV